METILIALQVFQVAFLGMHDWVPLGSFNDVAAVRRENSLRDLVVTTLIQSVPWTIGLAGCLLHRGEPWPGWLASWLWISYGLLFLGELRAWWRPYLFRPEPARAERYRRMFGRTHAFLPVRNGMTPNTLHTLLHMATAAPLLLLACGLPFS